MSAFPDKEDGGPGRVLFRVEPDHRSQGIMVLVQSTGPPDWSKLNVKEDFLVEKPEIKEYKPELKKGQLLRFRLLANPTVKKDGKRLGILGEQEQYQWFTRKSEQCGFEPLNIMTVPVGFVKASKNKGKTPISLHAVRYEGIIRVREPETFVESLQNGIGSAKGMGFGLLSIAPAKGN